MLGSVEFGETAAIADLEAGIGTLTRLDRQSVDVILVVVEPTPKSLEVGTRAAELVREKALGQILVVGNRIRNDDDVALVRTAFPGDEIAVIPDDPAIREADRDGIAPLDATPNAPAVQALVRLAEHLLELAA